ncbi:Panacea domain-containing protein [Aliidiomarina maris]|uniref:Uncharacterized protein DUF4065 n=1 Tax=Aliidiomarina maris TaxID=531312 RepID=A0A327X444_9GAMM|nr:Panacea domain-containing protein [Aliidiomarina maris]RAK01655.1 uncharacterized protein DUF4065 [Aliidiomarina maris]RUO28479.1 hypothetical protein CWE07_01330 [Aliidiomarina maris]
MTKLQNLIAYLCVHYPHKSELSKARLTKLVYLSDWIAALNLGSPLTEIKWLFNHYGPYVDDVFESAVQRPDIFKITTEPTPYGTASTKLQYVGHPFEICLGESDKRVLNFVIERTKSMYFNEFINFVYSTYPVANSTRYSELNLLSLAEEYKHSKSNETH